MTTQDFYLQMREHMHRQPFVPFVVLLSDGREILVKTPPVAFCDEGASFIDLEAETLVSFDHEETVAFRASHAGARS